MQINRRITIKSVHKKRKDANEVQVTFQKETTFKEALTLLELSRRQIQDLLQLKASNLNITEERLHEILDQPIYNFDE